MPEETGKKKTKNKPLANLDAQKDKARKKIQKALADMLMVIPKDYDIQARLVALQLNRQKFEGLFSHLPDSTQKSTKSKQKDTFDKIQKVYKVIDQLMLPDRVALEALDDINSEVVACMAMDSKFFWRILRALMDKGLQAKALPILFKLKCLTDETMQGLHKLILTEILDGNNLEMLCHYLEKHPSRVPLVVDSGFLLWLILNAPAVVQSQIKCCAYEAGMTAHVDHVFYLCANISPDLCKLVHEHIQTKLSDFPWSEKNKNKLRQTGNFLHAMDSINGEFLDKLTGLGKKYFTETSLRFLISYFYLATRLSDREPLNNYLIKVAQWTVHPENYSIKVDQWTAPLALKGVLDTLLQMSASWLMCHNVPQCHMHVEIKKFQISLAMLEVFTSNSAFLSGNAFCPPEFKTITSLLQAIGTFDFNIMREVYSDCLGAQDGSMTRKQYNTIELINAMVKKTFSILLERVSDVNQTILRDINPIMTEFSKVQNQGLQRTDVKLFAFENSIKSELEDLPFLLRQDFKHYFFSSLHKCDTEIFYAFLKRIKDESQVLTLLECASKLCKNLGFHPLIKEVESYCRKRLEDAAWQASVEVILNTETLGPQLEGLGIEEVMLNAFYKAYLERNFDIKKEELASLFQYIYSTEDAFIIEYFVYIMDYYVDSLRGDLPKEDLVIKPLLEVLRKKEKGIKESQVVPKRPEKQKKGRADKEFKREHELPSSKSKAEDSESRRALTPGVTQSARCLELKPLPGRVDQRGELGLAFQRKTLYSLFLDMFLQVKMQIDQCKEEGEALKIDREHYTSVYVSLAATLSPLIAEQEKILSEAQVPYCEAFRCKKKTSLLKDSLESLSDFSPEQLFKLHNQIVLALTKELRKRKSLSDQEKEIIAHCEQWVVLAFSGFSLPIQSELFRLKKLVKILESKALGEPEIFHNCQEDFLKIAAYGFVVSRALFDWSKREEPRESKGEASRKSLVCPKEVINTLFYIDSDCLNGEAINSDQLNRLNQLIGEVLNLGSVNNGRWTWFKDEQAYELILQAKPPTPVLSYYAIMWRLNDNKVQVLKNGKYALSHIKSNRINIIAEERQLFDKNILAQVLEELLNLLCFLGSDAQVTDQSKRILGNLFLDTTLALDTIVHFITLYGPANPQLYSQQFMKIPLPLNQPLLLTEKTDLNLTMKDYMISFCLTVYGRLNKREVLKELERLDFTQMFAKPRSFELLKISLFQYIHEQIALYEAKQRGARNQHSFNPPQVAPVVFEDAKAVSMVLW